MSTILKVGRVSAIVSITVVFSLLISNSVLAEPINPNLNYYSNISIEVDNSKLTQIVENAILLNYSIQNMTSPGGCKNPQPGGGCKGKDIILEEFEYINAENEIMFLSSQKRMYINYGNELGAIQSFTEDVDFHFSSYGVIFTSNNSFLSTEKASKIIVNELKALGILDEDKNITIQFESFPSITYHSNRDNIQFSSISFTIIIMLAIIILLILLMRRKSR